MVGRRQGTHLYPLAWILLKQLRQNYCCGWFSQDACLRNWRRDARSFAQGRQAWIHRSFVSPKYLAQRPTTPRISSRSIHPFLEGTARSEERRVGKE